MNNILSYKYQDFMIFFTFFLIWFSVQFGELVEDSVAYIMVVSVGILHGANDLLILSKKKSDKKSNLKSIAIYLGIIALCILTFYINSYVAILLFVILSSYHFGEEHLGEKLNQGTLFDTVYFSAYGVFLFSLLFYISQEDVAIIMKELTGSSFSELQIQISLGISGALLVLMSAYILLTKKKTEVNFGRELFYFLVLAVVFNTSSLVLSFAIYFIFWHSIPSIIHQTKFISGDFNKKAVIHYLKNASIFWGISLMGLVGLYFLFPELNQFASIVFAILFAVTAPHTWVMYQMKN
ncbi:MAG: beta-carotene 15,15'-dioxygenase [Flavobacteriaceae bacterium]|nr:beta-carotene 15,15'-dioxygenase [Flavobacteriaceae bacterium]|tara:strand:- start:80155 stop:81039 length:885 start_codon:yes stop_codon:yes gene_type:complete